MVAQVNEDELHPQAVARVHFEGDPLWCKLFYIMAKRVVFDMARLRAAHQAELNRIQQAREDMEKAQSDEVERIASAEIDVAACREAYVKHYITHGKFPEYQWDAPYACHARTLFEWEPRMSKEMRRHYRSYGLDSWASYPDGTPKNMYKVVLMPTYFQ